MRFTLILCLCSLFAGTAVAQEWETLFDGKSVEHWRGYKKKTFPEKGWVVEDGCLKVQRRGGGGDIVTRKQYADFELTFDWKVAAGANSGVMYRVTEDEHSPWRTGPEYQILDDAKHRDGRNPKTSAAALYAIYPARGGKVKPVGQFNSARIVLKGSKLEHWLNGKKVVTCDLASAEYAKLRDASKFKKMPNFGRRPRGHIALQDHGDDVWFKNIRIRDLSRPKDEGKDDRECSVLFVGNSYTYFNEMPNMLRGLSKKMSPAWNVKAAVCVGGGFSLERHVNERALPHIERNPWDWVVLQEQSTRPLEDPDAMQRAATVLHRAIKARSARTLFFVTWARKDKPKMTDALSAAYRRVAAKLGAPVAEVGKAFARVGRERPGIELYDADGSHPSPAGSYLAACVFLSVVTGETIAGLPGRVARDDKVLVDLDEATASYLQSVASTVAASRAVVPPK